MNLQTKVAKLERQTGADAIGFCSMCAERAASPARGRGLRVVESWNCEMSCPACARPVQIVVNHVERAKP